MPTCRCSSQACRLAIASRARVQEHCPQRERRHSWEKRHVCKQWRMYE